MVVVALWEFIFKNSWREVFFFGHLLRKTLAFDYITRIILTIVHFDYYIDNIDTHSQGHLTAFNIFIFIFLSFLLQMMTKLEPSMRFSAQPIAERKCIYQSKWPNCDRKLRCQCFQVCHSNYLIISFSQRLFYKSIISLSIDL